MDAKSCACVKATCPPCMGRCGCVFQRAETSWFSVGLLVVLAIAGVAFFRRFLRRRSA